MRAMPTGAKLMAALCFAALAYLVAGLYTPLLPDGFRVGKFSYFFSALGFIIGWFIMGRQVGVTLGVAAGRGVSAVVWLVFWALLSFSIHEMLLRALDKRYRMPMDAVGGVFEISYFFFLTGLTVEILATLVVGGMISGVLAELAHRKWR